MTDFERAMEWAQALGSDWARFDPIKQQMVHGNHSTLTISPVEALLSETPREYELRTNSRYEDG